MLMESVEVNVLGQHWARDNTYCVDQIQSRVAKKISLAVGCRLAADGQCRS